MNTAYKSQLSLFFVHFFFFSSRRRHTRFKCDWSSDVCSSDLIYTLSLQTNFAVAKNCGARRALVACSNANANLIKVDSLHARPKNEIPTGRLDRKSVV